MTNAVNNLASTSSAFAGNALPLSVRRMSKSDDSTSGVSGATPSGSFRDVLTNHMAGKMDDSKETQLRAKIRDVSEKYVAQSLVQPLLKQARELRDDAPPFGATQAEKQFGAMMDERTALEMVQRGKWNLVGSIEKRLLRAAGLEKPTPAPMPKGELAETEHSGGHS